MAVVSILDAFTYKWAQDGTAEALTDAQWKAGWAFIGATPPSVEQFNKWGQISDEKSNYLYSQLKTVYDLVGVVPGAADVNSLRDSLRGTGLFVTAAPGTNDTKAATTEFVTTAIANAVTLLSGRLLRTTRYVRVAGVQNISVDGGANTTVNAGTFTPLAAMKFCRVKVQGGGSGGAGAVAPAGGLVSLGAPGCAGSYGESLFTAATIGASQSVVVGLGSAGNSGAVGGSSSIGALITVPGGSLAGTLGSQTPPTLNGNGSLANAPTGANLISIQGSAPHLTVAQSATVGSGGAGGASVFGPGGNGPAMNVNGTNAVNPGSGGSGSLVNSGGGTSTSGNGAAGIVIIEEYA